FKAAAHLIPNEIMEKGGYDKFLKAAIGTVLHKLNVLDPDSPNFNNEIFKSIQAGYYFGLTYPLIDDLIDSSQFLSPGQKKSIMNTLIKVLSGEKITSASLPPIKIVYELKKLFDEFSLLFPFEHNPELYRS